MDSEQRVNFFRSLIQQVRKQEFPYEPRAPKKMDWKSYTMAQISEVNDMLCMIRDIVDAAWRRLETRLREEAGPGLTPVPAPDLAKAVLVQQYFGVSNREAEGLMLLFKEKLAVSRDFSYKSIERAYENQDVRRILDEVFALTQTPVEGLETSQAVDATGMPTTSKVNYEAVGKHTKRAGFEKIVTSIGTQFKLYSSVIPMEHRDDSETLYFPAVMNDLRQHTGIQFVLADSAYISRKNCDLVESIGAKPRMMPKSNATLARRGGDAYTHMAWEFMRDTQGWLRDYHLRSIAESGYSAEKRANPNPIRRRIHGRKQTEMRARFCNENLRRLCYMRYLDDISVDFTRTT